MTLTEQQQRTVDWVRSLVDSPRSFRDTAGEVVRHLRAGYPHYNWVGIYMVEGDVLRLWSWDGPAATEHVEIPLHAGVCGWAASTGQIANVPDVSKDPRYLACFLNTRSELVVPIRRGQTVYGEIDIDSDTLAAFDARDEAFLQQVGDLLALKAEREALAGRRLAG